MAVWQSGVRYPQPFGRFSKFSFGIFGKVQPVTQLHGLPIPTPLPYFLNSRLFYLGDQPAHLCAFNTMPVQHINSTIVDRAFGIGSRQTPKSPDESVVKKMEEMEQMPIQRHRDLWLSTQPIGPVQALLCAILLIVLIYAL